MLKSMRNWVSDNPEKYGIIVILSLLSAPFLGLLALSLRYNYDATMKFIISLIAG